MQGYLMRDRQERRKATEIKWITAWKIVDAQGETMVYPWDNTRKHALETAQKLGIEILGEFNGSRSNSQ